MPKKTEAKKREITDLEVRRLAVQAQCDPRTIRKLLLGGEVRGMSGDRAYQVLHEAGLVE